MPKFPRPILCLASLAAAMVTLACSPPVTRHRVDLVVQADGVCTLDREVVACRDAGPAAVRKYTAAVVSAVIVLDPAAPAESVQAMRAGIQTARILQMQYGDQAMLAMKQKSSTGIDF